MRQIFIITTQFNLLHIELIQILPIYFLTMLGPRKIILLLSFAMAVMTSCPLRCVSGCAGTPADSYTCSVCQAGFFVDSGRCAPCPADCAACTAWDACQTCRKTVTLQQQAPETGVCLQCALNCRSCSGLPTNCVSCYAPLVLGPLAAQRKCIASTDAVIPSKCSEIVTLNNLGQLSMFPDTNDFAYCSACHANYYAWLGKCYKCPFAAIDCIFPVNNVFNEIVVNTMNGVVVSFITGMPLDFTFAQNWLKESWVQFALIVKALLADPAKIDFYGRQLNFVIDDSLNPGQLIPKPGARMTSEEKVNFFNNATPIQTNFALTQVQNAIIMEVRKRLIINSCVQGFYATTGAFAQCRRCLYPCQVCNSDGTCLTCRIGFVATTPGTCETCHVSCRTCLAPNQALACQTCFPPLILVGGECKRCKPQCATCDTSGTNCVTCLRPFSLYPDPITLQCYRCAQDTCIDCFSTNNASCLECAQGFSLNGTKCVRCQSSCTACSVQNDRTVCRMCGSGFTLIADACVSCIVNCLTCSQKNNSICLKCANGFYIKSNQCSPCPKGCAECNDATFCTKWRPGFMSVSDVLVECRGQFCTACDSTLACVECEPGYFLDPTTKTCNPCSPFCLQCTPTMCIKCAGHAIMGTGASAGRCTACNSSCLTCLSTNLNSCKSCRDGLYLSGSSCLKCPKNCDSCTSSTICVKCRSGFILNNLNQCTQCATSCNGECSPLNVTQCFSCAPGFQLVSNKCVLCSSGCSICQNGQCTSCKNGFALVTSINGSSLVTRCRPTCRFPCQKCQNNTCLQCAQGYNLANGNCTVNLQCLPLNDASCICPEGSVKRTILSTTPPDTYQCINCATSCRTCSGTQTAGVFTTTCSQCMPGYLLSAGSCAACATGCRTCNGTGVCMQCLDGYANLEGTSKCVACQGCATCIEQPNRCLTCREGFNLVNDRCIGSFTMGFTLTYSDSFTSFYSATKLDTLITSLATILGLSEDRIIITDTRSGSTIVVGGASADNSSQAATFVASLSTAISANPAALGSNLLSTSSFAVQLNGIPYILPQPQNAQQPEGAQPETRNIGLIVGLTVGLVGAAMIATGIVVYLKKKASAMKLADSTEPNKTVEMDESFKQNNSVNELSFQNN